MARALTGRQAAAASPHRVSIWTNILLFLSVLGPGIVTAAVDNDAGGIATYSVAGAQFGYRFLWTIIPITLMLIVVQEMSARMGVVTGKGLSDLIREEFGVRATVLVAALLLLANLGNTVAEFAGIAASGNIFGVPKYLAVPIGAVIVWLLVLKGNYKSVEKIFLVASALYGAYVISGFMARPPWGEVVKATLTPSFSFEPGYLAMFIGLVGTTIAPWMQFYLQAAVVEKGVSLREYPLVRLDVVIGSLTTAIVAFFIIAACAATIGVKGIVIKDAGDAALALQPIAGRFASQLFAFGLFNASLFAASILPLSTAYYICEALGFEAGVNKTFGEAPQFYTLYTLIIAVGAGLILIPKAPLVPIMIWSQVANGILLPFILVFMLKLVNDRRLMGEHVNSRAFNWVAWACAVVTTVLTVLLVVTSVFPGILG